MYRENLYIVKTLKEFQYIDEDGKDQGANGKAHNSPFTPTPFQEREKPSSKKKTDSNFLFFSVRQKAKDITSLLLDEKRMKSQRATRKDMRSRMAGERPEGGRERSNSRPQPNNNNDGDLQAAIEASKKSAEEEARRNRADQDLEEAMRLSREEDERRRRELAANGNSDLFDEQRQSVFYFPFSSLLVTFLSYILMKRLVVCFS